MIIDDVTREQYIKFATTCKEDKFSKYYIYHADLQNMWEWTVGCWDNGELMGAITVTTTKRQPKCANIQLLHVMHKYRKKGIGKILCCDYAYRFAKLTNSSYFRVSANPDAREFYERIGFKFWGLQRSGCSLSIFRIAGDTINDGIYDETDPYIHRCLYTGARGSLVPGSKGSIA